MSDESGATSIECAFMLALVILVCIVGIRLFGLATNATMQNNASRIESSIQGTTVQYVAEQREAAR